MKNEKIVWMSKADSFEVIDVRKASGNFLPGLLNKGKEKEIGEGIIIIQSFEPKPLYKAYTDLGYEYYTEKINETEYKTYFFRISKREMSQKSGDMPFKPTSILNYKEIDSRLADTVVNFWEFIWEKENPAIDLKTKLLLSLANAVGAGRYRQATRELIKAYSIGLKTEELDELFSLFVWNQGIGYFSSEIGPSTLFKTYKFIKSQEKLGKDRSEIMEKLVELFGDKNPDVKTI
ncbi:hypothetical protein [Fusobacterium sp. MFO224]|uniref:hypothetical protein n=1 Tax=Fusobacterium sp. MFO224 TaxID=3378070 RepID=UPI003853FB22